MVSPPGLCLPEGTGRQPSIGAQCTCRYCQTVNTLFAQCTDPSVYGFGAHFFLESTPAVRRRGPSTLWLQRASQQSWTGRNEASQGSGSMPPCGACPTAMRPCLCCFLIPKISPLHQATGSVSGHGGVGQMVRSVCVVLKQPLGNGPDVIQQLFNVQDSEGRNAPS